MGCGLGVESRESVHKMVDLRNVGDTDSGSGTESGVVGEATAFKIGYYSDGVSETEWRKVELKNPTLRNIILMCETLFENSTKSAHTLGYRDTDGDFITLGSEEEFKTFLDESNLYQRKLLLQPKDKVSHFPIIGNRGTTAFRTSSQNQISQRVGEVSLQSGTIDCFLTHWFDSEVSHTTRGPADITSPPSALEFEKNISKYKNQTSAIYWKCGRLLGSGAFGSVYMAMNTDTGMLMAVKRIPFEGTEEHLRSLERELSALQELSHPRIVSYLGVAMEIRHSCAFVDIFMEYIPGGSIAQALQQFGAFSEQVTKKYTFQILEGLSFLHSKNIVHRDVKGGNILMTGQGEVKLSDFGSSKCLKDISNHSQLKGTIRWMSPEAIRGNISTKADIWSVGVTVLEMLSKSILLNEGVDQLNFFSLGTTPRSPTLPEYLSASCLLFLTECFSIDFTTRPSAAELLEHEFLQNISDVVEDDQNLSSPTCSSQSSPTQSCESTVLSPNKNIRTPESNWNVSTAVRKLRPSSAPLTAPEMYMESMAVRYVT